MLYLGCDSCWLNRRHQGVGVFRLKHPSKTILVLTLKKLKDAVYWFGFCAFASSVFVQCGIAQLSQCLCGIVLLECVRSVPDIHDRCCCNSGWSTPELVQNLRFPPSHALRLEKSFSRRASAHRVALLRRTGMRICLAAAGEAARALK